MSTREQDELGAHGVAVPARRASELVDASAVAPRRRVARARRAPVQRHRVTRPAAESGWTGSGGGASGIAIPTSGPERGRRRRSRHAGPSDQREHDADRRAGARRDDLAAAGRQAHREAGHRRREHDVEPERARVRDRAAQQHAGERREVPGDEHAQHRADPVAAARRPGPRRWKWVAASANASSVSTWAIAARWSDRDLAQPRRERGAVEQVARVEEEREHEIGSHGSPARRSPPPRTALRPRTRSCSSRRASTGE